MIVNKILLLWIKKLLTNKKIKNSFQEGFMSAMMKAKLNKLKNESKKIETEQMKLSTVFLKEIKTLT
jgi:hypothetical protein